MKPGGCVQAFQLTLLPPYTLVMDPNLAVAAVIQKCYYSFIPKTALTYRRQELSYAFLKLCKYSQQFCCMYRAFCTVYYPDQQKHYIYVYTIFHTSQTLLHVPMHLHHLQGVLSFYFAKVTKIIQDYKHQHRDYN